MARYEITNDALPIDFTADRDHTARTLQNCKNLLMTRKGEIPFDRRRGLDPAIFDLPVTEMKARLLPELDRMLRWEPEAEVADAELALREDGTLRIRMVVEVR